MDFQFWKKKNNMPTTKNTENLEGISNFEWSINPGAYEIHLIRRNNNPLFKSERRLVTAEDVHNAKLLDALGWDKIRKEADDIKAELLRSETDIPEDWRLYLGQMRERIDSASEVASSLGRNSKGLERYLSELRIFVTDFSMDLIKSDPEAVIAFEKAETLHKEHQIVFYGTEWLSQIRHPEKIIPFDEVIPSLLTESVEILKENISIIKSQPALRSMLLNIRTGALETVKPLLISGYSIPNIKEKLAIIGVSL